MADTFKFPNGGYDVTICRKQDIIDCIEKNITDKEVAMAIVEHCEFQAANFIKEGRWTGLPFIGNVRVPQTIKMMKSEEQRSLLREAKEELSSEQYVLFRKQLNKDNVKRIAHNRYYKYITSIAVNKNRKLFNKLCKTKGEAYARLYFYCSYNITAINNEYIYLDNE